MKAGGPIGSCSDGRHDLRAQRPEFATQKSSHGGVRHRTAGFETVRALVAHDHGWSVLNQRPASPVTYDGAEVVTLEIKDAVEPLAIVLASMSGVRLTRRAQAFIRSSGRAAREARAGR